MNFRRSIVLLLAGVIPLWAYSAYLYLQVLPVCRELFDSMTMPWPMLLQVLMRSAALISRVPLALPLLGSGLVGTGALLLYRGGRLGWWLSLALLLVSLLMAGYPHWALYSATWTYRDLNPGVDRLSLADIYAYGKVSRSLTLLVEPGPEPDLVSYEILNLGDEVCSMASGELSSESGRFEPAGLAFADQLIQPGQSLKGETRFQLLPGAARRPVALRCKLYGVLPRSADFPISLWTSYEPEQP